MMADVLGDQHLRFNGSILSYYIQLPIAEGENLVHNNMLYHIERVMHAGNIGPLGNKIGTTTLDLTYGIPLKVLNAYADVIGGLSPSGDAIRKVEVEEGGKLAELRNNRVDLENVGVLGAISTTIK
jgi:hypothetical protein